jgi:transcriptional antiterminator NusG
VTDESNNANPLPPEAPVGPAAEATATRGDDLASRPEPVAEDALDSAADGESTEKVQSPAGDERAEQGLSADGPAEPLAEVRVAPPAAPKSKPARAKKAAAVAEPKAEEVKPAEPKSDKMDWYILKVQSNREDSIREGLQRRVRIAGLDKYFGDVIVPIEMVTEFKGGKKRVVKRKLYPGYLVVQMEINEDTWFLVRETPGIGDFTGASGRPSPMLPHEIAKIIARQEEKSEDAPKLKINFNTGDRVKINDGTFENFEGEVEAIDQQNGRVTVMINIFGRSTPVELEYWQIEAV